MTPAIVTLTLIQGQTFEQEFVFNDPNGVAENFTGYQARMQIRATITDPEIILALGTADGSILPLDTTGTVKFNLPAAITSAINTDHMYETWWYDLEIFNVAGRVQRLMQGPVVFWPENTR